MEMRTRMGLLATVFAALFTVGCEQEGPMEETGENIDRTMEETGEAMDNTGERITE